MALKTYYVVGSNLIARTYDEAKQACEVLYPSVLDDEISLTYLDFITPAFVLAPTKCADEQRPKGYSLLVESAEVD